MAGGLEDIQVILNPKSPVEYAAALSNSDSPIFKLEKQILEQLKQEELTLLEEFVMIGMLLSQEKQKEKQEFLDKLLDVESQKQKETQQYNEDVSLREHQEAMQRIVQEQNTSAEKNAMAIMELQNRIASLSKEIIRIKDIIKDDKSVEVAAKKVDSDWGSLQETRSKKVNENLKAAGDIKDATGKPIDLSQSIAAPSPSQLMKVAPHLIDQPPKTMGKAQDFKEELTRLAGSDPDQIQSPQQILAAIRHNQGRLGKAIISGKSEAETSAGMSTEDVLSRGQDIAEHQRAKKLGQTSRLENKLEAAQGEFARNSQTIEVIKQHGIEGFAPPPPAPPLEMKEQKASQSPNVHEARANLHQEMRDVGFDSGKEQSPKEILDAIKNKNKSAAKVTVEAEHLGGYHEPDKGTRHERKINMSNDSLIMSQACKDLNAGKKSKNKWSLDIAKDSYKFSSKDKGSFSFDRASQSFSAEGSASKETLKAMMDVCKKTFPGQDITIIGVVSDTLKEACKESGFDVNKIKYMEAKPSAIPTATAHEEKKPQMEQEKNATQTYTSRGLGGAS